MKKIVVLSDTHGRKENVDELEAVFAEADIVVHLGDGSADMRDIARKYPDKVLQTSGNCDLFRLYPENQFEADGVKFFYCHGDKFRVKTHYDDLVAEAKKRGCSVALFGHTHRAEIVTVDGVTLVNPGSMRLPKTLGGSYAYIVVSDGKARPVIVGDLGGII